MNDVARKQAAAELGVPPESGAESVRAAFLLKLAREGFAVSERAVAALNVLGLPMPLSSESQQEMDQFELAEVHAFAEQFWEMEPEPRAERWTALFEWHRSPPARNALDRLGNIISHRVRDYGEEKLNALAAEARALGVLAPRERAVRRQEWLEQHGQNPEWHLLATRLKAADPTIVPCDPGLFEALGGGTYQNHKGAVQIGSIFDSQSTFTSMPVYGGGGNVKKPLSSEGTFKLHPMKIDALPKETIDRINALDMELRLKNHRKALKRIERTDYARQFLSFVGRNFFLCFILFFFFVGFISSFLGGYSSKTNNAPAPNQRPGLVLPQDALKYNQLNNYQPPAPGELLKDYLARQMLDQSERQESFWRFFHRKLRVQVPPR